MREISFYYAKPLVVQFITAAIIILTCSETDTLNRVLTLQKSKYVVLAIGKETDVEDQRSRTLLCPGKTALT